MVARLAEKDYTEYGPQVAGGFEVHSRGREYHHPPAELEDIYRDAVGRAVRHAVIRWPRLVIVLDKRYTAKKLRYALEQSIREQISDLRQEVVLIQQEESLARKELQATDYVAWAFFQKYERGDSRFYDLIAERVIVEEVVERNIIYLSAISRLTCGVNSYAPFIRRPTPAHPRPSRKRRAPAKRDLT